MKLLFEMGVCHAKGKQQRLLKNLYWIRDISALTGISASDR